MVDNNRVTAFTFTAYPGRKLGTGNFAKRDHSLTDNLPSGCSLVSVT